VQKFLLTGQVLVNSQLDCLQHEAEIKHIENIESQYI